MNDAFKGLPFLDPLMVRLTLDSSGHLEGSVGGAEQLTGLRAKAAFPFQLPGQFIELRDDKGEIVGFIRRVDELPAQSREAVEKALRLQHFVPFIKRVISIKGKAGMYTWQVVTDRGETEFTTRGRRQNIEEISGDEHLVTDSEGNRYRIPRVPELDARSLMHLHKIL